ncbi:MAG TPA: hypothetical protein VGJ20_02865 [Xanthobacteraceae bacterium]
MSLPCGVVVSAHGSPRLLKPAPSFSMSIDDPEQVEGRARQLVELRYDQDRASLKLIERAPHFWPPSGNAGHFSLNIRSTPAA